MNQFGYPPGSVPPVSLQQQWPQFAANPAPMGAPAYPAVASQSHPQMGPPGYPGAGPFTPMATPPVPTMAQAPMASAGIGGVPAFYIPDEEMVRAQYREFQEEAAQRGGTRAQYVKFPGPQGQTKWDMVPAGYAVSLNVYILPAWKSGVNVYRRVRSHFWRSHQHPKGASINCTGPETCLLCKARDAGINSTDPMIQKRAKDYGRTRTQYLYNVVLLDNPTGHIDRTGQMRPFILGAGQTLHDAIQNFISERGLISIVHPLNGRPLKITRKKTGPNEMDVEYSVVDMNPAPLHPYYYPALAALWDLDAEDKQAAPDQQMRAVQELGLPMPMEAMGSVPGYTAQPGMPMAPMGPNPFPVGSPTGPVMMPPPAFGPPPMPSAQQQFGGFPPVPQPQSYFSGMAAPMAPPAPFSGMTQPQMVPPQMTQPQMASPQMAQSQMAQPQMAVSAQFAGIPAQHTHSPSPMEPPSMPSMPPPPMPSMGPPSFMAPPPMPIPPPVQSGSISPSPYAPQPGSGMAPMPLAASPSPPVSALASSALSAPAGGAFSPPNAGPPMAGVSLPGGRERCFGRFSAQDRYCQECPPDIGAQCQRTAQAIGGAPFAAPSLGGSPPQPGAPTLAQLSSQLSGGS